MAQYTIPSGKIVRIFIDGQNIMDNPNIARGIQLVLQEPVTLNVSSNFQPFFGDVGNSLMNTIGSFARDIGLGTGFSSQKKQFGFQTWSNSEPVSLSLTFQFHYGMANQFNGYTEVETPIDILTQIPLPAEPTKDGLFATLIPPGPSILSLLTNESSTFLRGSIISMQIGNSYRFPNIIVRRVEPTKSDEKDSQGYAIEGKVAMEISTIFNATKNMFQRKETISTIRF